MMASNNNYYNHNDDDHHHHHFITEKNRWHGQKLGPNDVSGVIWAQVSFFFSSSYYLILTNVLFYIQLVSMMYMNGRGLEDAERQKLAQMTCLASFGP